MNKKSIWTKPMVAVLHPAIIGTSMIVAVASAVSLSAADRDNNTEPTIRGNIKSDFIIDEGADFADSFAFSTIPATGSGDVDRDGHIPLHARQSRLRIQSNTNLPNSEFLKTHLKGDFFGPDGKSVTRQGQIHYTLPNVLAFFPEKPETDGDGAPGRLRESSGGAGSGRFTDVGVAWRGGLGGMYGSYETAAFYRSFGVDSVLDETRVDDNENGWVVNLAGAWESGNNSESASVTASDGIDRHLIAGGGNDLAIDATGRVETVKNLGASLTYTRKWLSNMNSTLAYGYLENDNPARSNGIDNLTSVYLNTF